MRELHEPLFLIFLPQPGFNVFVDERTEDHLRDPDSGDILQYAYAVTWRSGNYSSIIMLGIDANEAEHDEEEARNLARHYGAQGLRALVWDDVCNAVMHYNR